MHIFSRGGACGRVWADTCSLLVRCSTHVFANAIDVGLHDQLLVATDAEVSDFVHLLLGVLQRLDHKPHIPSL